MRLLLVGLAALLLIEPAGAQTRYTYSKGQPPATALTKASDSAAVADRPSSEP